MKSISLNAWSHAITGEIFAPILSAERCGFSFSGCLISRSTSRQNGFTNGKKRMPRQAAKTVSVTAIGAIMCVYAGTPCPETVIVSATLQFGKSAWPSFTKSGKNQMRTSEPRALESVCDRAVRFASAVPPIAAIQPVAVVPMFAPKRTAIATS